MSTRYARQARAQSNPNGVLTIDGRRYRATWFGKLRILGEIKNIGDGCCEVWPKSSIHNFGFRLLEEAGVDRRSAARQTDEFRRRHLLRRARATLERSRDFDAPMLPDAADPFQSEVREAA